MLDLEFELLPNEEWRYAKGFGNTIAVSSKGRLASVRKNGVWRLAKLIKTPANYYLYGFHTRPTQKFVFVHRIVAETFIENPYNLPFVNHKDENGLNNDVSNLEWCNQLYNNTYGTVLERSHKTRMKHNHCVEVDVYDLKGNLLNSYDSMYRASKAEGIPYGTIESCAKGRHLTCREKVFLMKGQSISERLTTIRNASYQCFSKKLLSA